MTAPLDEARLRELAEAQEKAVQDAKAWIARVEDGNQCVDPWEGLSLLQAALKVVESRLEETEWARDQSSAKWAQALIDQTDALSAERERADRAVSNATIALRVLNSIPEHTLIDGMTVAWCSSDDVPEDIYTAKSYLELATQKAEGGE